MGHLIEAENGGCYGNRSEWGIWCGPNPDFRGVGSGAEIHQSGVFITLYMKLSIIPLMKLWQVIVMKLEYSFRKIILLKLLTMDVGFPLVLIIKQGFRQ